MPLGYHHLTKYLRCQIYTLKKRGDSISTIAKELNIHKSTVSRELKRNAGMKGYRYKQAHEKARYRRHCASKQRRKMTPQTIAVVDEKLKIQWSPEQISGWLRRNGYPQAVSHEVIYQHVWRDKKKGGTLYKHLRHNGKKYNKRSKHKAGRGCIPNRVDISERPVEVEEKLRLGDWELDTIIGTGQSGAIVSMVERCSKLTLLAKVERNMAALVGDALLEKLSPIQAFVETATSDNGKEFANHERIKEKLGADFYFARPYHSWERGLNEHTNGLVRQYYPKKKRFDDIDADDLQEIENLLNNRPRKVLDFQTPKEVFNKLSGGALNLIQ